MRDVTELALAVRLLALDVDGVLSDGTLFYSNSGDELKGFNIKDGQGIKLLQRAGIDVAIVTGRESALLARRAAELGISAVIQGREDKRTALSELARSRDLELSACAYMGDDLPDLGAIRAAGLGACPADAASTVIEHADWVSRLAGGRGAVRELCELLLRAQGRWDDAIAPYSQ